ncbi:hypothetical protein I5M27_12700 [Adhaeribacter sp. BT258]|uniref:Lipoprotein n=1 Tax=Adhaeribacter terrigena TaxID=2793070 RepID=A0ABS1C3W2_9BACT|nr:hypothetical protein [Adhaeribacter terrigena]MBK0403851.1 hypothetical protein [Adhaeribacter terrigena]
MKPLFLKYSWLPFLLLFSACMKEPVYPSEPQIEFKSITGKTIFDEFRQTEIAEIKITINFKDGDGNLGIDNANPADSLAPFDYANGFNKFHHNYFIEAFIENNGKFEPLNFPISLNGRYPLLNPDGEKRALEGELLYTIDDLIISYLPLSFKSGDRMKFRVSIADRSLNVSNTIETDPVQIFF